jgi:hypothetical protein
MKGFDLRAIRNALPLGALAEIAERLHVTPQTVSNVLNRGWKPELRNSVVNLALEIIKSKDSDPALINEADAMKLTTNQAFSVPYRRKKKHSSQDAGGHPMDWFHHNKMIILLIGAVIAFFFIRKKMSTTQTLIPR